MNDIYASGRKILVVEDEPAVAAFCLRVLAMEGYEVETAINSKIALSMVNNKQYDLLLVDIRMPVMNGIELYRWLEKENKQMTKKVVFTTGSLLTGDTTRFITETGRPLLPKPFTPDELTAIIKENITEIAE